MKRRWWPIVVLVALFTLISTAGSVECVTKNYIIVSEYSHSDQVGNWPPNSYDEWCIWITGCFMDPWWEWPGQVHWTVHTHKLWNGATWVDLSYEWSSYRCNHYGISGLWGHNELKCGEGVPLVVRG